jgi:hypothetical protein
MTAATLLFLAACLVLAYTGFCRLVRTDARTVLCIRGVFWLLTAVALVAVAEVVVWGYQPGMPAAMLACAFAAVQVATSILWRQGVPADYQTAPADLVDSTD